MLLLKRPFFSSLSLHVFFHATAAAVFLIGYCHVLFLRYG